MTQKPLNRITVAEIMRGCGMARQHFYYHFDNVYDAVRWIFEEEAVALLREHEGVMLWQDGLLQLFQYLQENRAFCLCALRSMGRDHLKRFFQTDIRTIIQSTIRLIAAELGYEAGEQELTMLTQFYVGALVSIVEDWLLGEIQGTPEELSRFVDQVLCGTMCVAPGSGCPRQVPGRRLFWNRTTVPDLFPNKKAPGSQRNPEPFSAVQLSVGRSLLRIVKPEISLVLVAGGLQPGVAVQMANHPAGIHLEARRHCLGMQAPAGDGGEAVVHALEYLVPTKLAPKPSGRSNLK